MHDFPLVFTNLYLHPARFVVLETVTFLFVLGFVLPWYKQKNLKVYFNLHLYPVVWSNPDALHKIK